MARYSVVLMATGNRVIVAESGRTDVIVNDDDGKGIQTIRPSKQTCMAIIMLTDVVISMVTGTITQTEADGNVDVCARVTGPVSLDQPITVRFTRGDDNCKCTYFVALFSLSLSQL